MTAVGCKCRVAGPEVAERADNRRFRAIGQMRVAADDARVLLERALDPLLELADPEHLRVHPGQPLVVEFSHG